MEGIKLLIIIFGLLFLAERKPMNILFNFIALVVLVAILLAQSGVEYFSYLLIIIYCSALTIIFGFVIMLTPYHITPPTKRGGILFLFVFLPFTFYMLNSPVEVIPPSISIDGAGVLEKIGNLLYNEETNIVKFMIATLILLLALIALFLLLLPTY